MEGILSSIHVPTLRRCGELGLRPLGRESSPLGFRPRRHVELPGRDHMIDQWDWRRHWRRWSGSSSRCRRPSRRCDRVLATVMFTDLVGSTERAARLGDLAWRDPLDQHHAAVRRRAGSHAAGRSTPPATASSPLRRPGSRDSVWRSRCVTASGLGLGVQLGAPRPANASASARACGAWLSIIGARIGASAEPGEILVSSTVRDLVAGSGIGFADAGRRG